MKKALITIMIIVFAIASFLISIRIIDRYSHPEWYKLSSALCKNNPEIEKIDIQVMSFPAIDINIYINDTSASFECVEKIFTDFIANYSINFIEETKMRILPNYGHSMEFVFISNDSSHSGLYRYRSKYETNYTEWTLEQSIDESVLKKQYYVAFS